jgi:hypothetical protein
MITKRRSDHKRTLLSVAIVFLVSGCVAATAPTGMGGPTERREPTEARGVDPATPTTMMFQVPEPPGSTLSYGGETVDGGLGTYCWTAGGAGGCSDAFAIVLGERVLEAPAGATLSFAYGGRALDSLSATAYRADREARGGPRQDDMFLPPARGAGRKDLPVRRSGTRARIVADLPAGEYVLDVFARMPQGDASYGFRLILEPRDPGGT